MQTLNKVITDWPDLNKEQMHGLFDLSSNKRILDSEIKMVWVVWTVWKKGTSQIVTYVLSCQINISCNKSTSQGICA